MSTSTTPAAAQQPALAMHATFLAEVLPRVERHGRIYFRHVRCHDRKEELLAELRGLAWKWYARLVRRVVVRGPLQLYRLRRPVLEAQE